MLLHRYRVYADVNAHRPRDNADANNYEIKWIESDFSIENNSEKEPLKKNTGARMPNTVALVP